jgi:hypothetical protein
MISCQVSTLGSKKNDSAHSTTSTVQNLAWLPDGTRIATGGHNPQGLGIPSAVGRPGRIRSW